MAKVNKRLGYRSDYLFECISPLSFKADTVDMAMAFAKEGGGLGIAPMAMSSATAPATIAGTLTQETAEVLGSGFLVHTMTGEYPGFAASCHSSDPQTMICSFGSPNQALFAAAAGQLARYYGIQGGCNTGLTDALTPDFQAGFEVTEETIGFDTIKEVGPSGNFLGEEHTADNIRGSYWFSKIFNRQDWAALNHRRYDCFHGRGAYVRQNIANLALAYRQEAV